MRRIIRINSAKLFSISALGLALGLTFMSGCTGGLQFSAAVSANDPVPDGTISVQGVFTGKATGNAAIFLTNAGAYIIRLENFSGPAKSPLTVVGTSNGVDVLSVNLKAKSGNQNYLTGISGFQTWSSVEIRDPAVPPPGNIVATALLQ